MSRLHRIAYVAAMYKISLGRRGFAVLLAPSRCHRGRRQRQGGWRPMDANRAEYRFLAAEHRSTHRVSIRNGEQDPAARCEDQIPEDMGLDRRLQGTGPSIQSGPASHQKQFSGLSGSQAVWFVASTCVCRQRIPGSQAWTPAARRTRLSAPKEPAPERTDRRSPASSHPPGPYSQDRPSPWQNTGSGRGSPEGLQGLHRREPGEPAIGIGRPAPARPLDSPLVEPFPLSAEALPVIAEIPIHVCCAPVGSNLAERVVFRRLPFLSSHAHMQLDLAHVDTGNYRRLVPLFVPSR